jgi:hypothetical protein
MPSAAQVGLLLCVDGCAGDEVEPVLDDAVAGKGELRGDLPRVLQALEAEVRGAEVADLAGAHERVEGLGHGDLVDFVIVAVGVVDVDVVGAQATQGIVDAVADIRGVESRVLGVLADLRRDDHLVTVAAGLHPFADDRLGFAAGVAVDPGRVRIGCVDEVSAGLGVGVEDREALIPIRAPAEGIASQLEGVDVKIGICQLHTCHASSLPAGICRGSGPVHGVIHREPGPVPVPS